MRALLRAELVRSLERPGARAAPFSARPWVVFVVGVNGAGKTTTIGKLAAAWSGEGRSVLLCAADTFRAAAAEQLEVWSGRAASASFHRGPEGADPSAVLTDALRMARAHGKDAVLVDTAGRLHTKSNLMAELAKMARVAGREIPGAPHETLLVLDATVGSNGLAQGREFAKAGGRHRARAHEARRHRQGRRRGRGGAGARRADPLRRRGRAGGRPAAVRRRRVRGRPAGRLT